MAKFFMLMAILLLGANALLAQRKNQMEFYGGAAFPLSPKEFKEYTKVGLSGNFQYVLFPSPNFGVTFNVGYEFFSLDNDKFVDALSEELTGQTAAYWVQSGFNINPSADIKSNVFRFGAGVRPYLTKPEANTQFFLLGQANFNIIQNDYNVTQVPIQYDPLNDQLFFFTGNDKDFEQIEENDENKAGFGFGAGVEIPAGSSLNLVLQGLFNIVLTSDKSTSFMGVTAGLVF
jgi:hypothetical protein